MVFYGWGSPFIIGMAGESKLFLNRAPITRSARTGRSHHQAESVFGAPAAESIAPSKVERALLQWILADFGGRLTRRRGC